MIFITEGKYKEKGKKKYNIIFGGFTTIRMKTTLFLVLASCSVTLIKEAVNSSETQIKIKLLKTFCSMVKF
jgi:hypothetical protein